MIPAAIHQRADAAIKAIKQGVCKPRKLKRHHDAYAYDLGRSWRLLKIDGHDWQLYSHEDYTKRLRRPLGNGTKTLIHEHTRYRK